ncbi:hypothetical protein L1987_28568 [Smallanthus sonchifolius]|uniref:Uncharacterized protein n=1 Tax=Smallanthus sonchifolius TaxID=185202 RepID=A0ACB9HY36_9ASTR|nr:hypothetical protein L1987_28568 [Smallanthus sonchifolius]
MIAAKKTANVVAGKTARACDSCARKRARWYCAADDAFLCQSCDASVHSANQLAGRHERVLLKTTSSKVFGLDEPTPCEPTWHQGFTRRARTPRQRTKYSLKIEGKHDAANSEVPLVPEIGVFEASLLDDDEEEEFSHCVPVYDPFETELCNDSNEIGRSLSFIGENKKEDECFDLPDDDLDLLDFATDVECLLGKGFDDASCRIEDLGLTNNYKDEGNSNYIGTCLGENRVKVEDKEVEAILGFDHWDFEYETSMVIKEEEKKVASIEGGHMMVSNDRFDNAKVRPWSITLRLNYEDVINTWADQGSPWTNGTRPELKPDGSWPDFMVHELMDHVDRCCKHEKAVNVGAAAFTTMLNIFSNLVFSMDFAQYDSASSQEFKDTVWALMEVGGKPNIVDYFPILKPIDPQGLVRWVYVCGKKLLTIFDRVIDQRLEKRSNTSFYDDTSSMDVLESLLNLNLKEKPEFGRDDMRHLFLDIFLAGTDTISGTLEWAMSELIRNPDKMKMARLELSELMKNEDRNIQEQDISQLPYLQTIIKETLRLHPAAPFLIPHQAIHDVEVQGFIVPKNAQILCNVWAMGRDPNMWLDPKTFMPERFLDVQIDYKGQDFELIPFGAGRRICPGLNFAHRMLHMVLGSLIQKFDWKLVGNMRPQDMDMREKFGITLQRNVPLMAIPIKL